jgi:hypothetical protein
MASRGPAETNRQSGIVRKESEQTMSMKIRRKAIKERLQWERADDVVNGAVLFFFGMVVFVLLAGCGGSRERSEEKLSTWNVATNSVNAIELSRTWEICGGTISCSYQHEAPPNRAAYGGFVGSATASQAACYRQYSGSNNLTEAAGQCQ